MAQSGIPIIDINSADEATIGKQLVDAAEEHGFIYIRNLGQDISVEQIDEAFALVLTGLQSPPSSFPTNNMLVKEAVWCAAGGKGLLRDSDK